LVENNPRLGPISEVIYNPLQCLEQTPIEGEDLGYFGGLNLRKGFAVLRKAVTLVKARTHWEAVIHATKFAGASASLASGLRQHGFVLYDKLNPNEYRKMYGCVRTVIVPSIWPEPWPYVVVEAIVNARLVIASNIGGISEQLEQCRGVTLLEPGNHERLAEAILSSRELDKATVAEFGFHNRESFLRKHPTEKTVEAFMKVCRRLVR
jgi:glycosyltransferase involved in cell wall biosynthesis